MQLTKGAIGNLINRYKAVLKKCHLMNTFGSLAVAGMLIMGGTGVAVAGAAASPDWGTADEPNTTGYTWKGEETVTHTGDVHIKTGNVRAFQAYQDGTYPNHTPIHTSEKGTISLGSDSSTIVISSSIKQGNSYGVLVFDNSQAAHSDQLKLDLTGDTISISAESKDGYAGALHVSSDVTVSDKDKNNTVNIVSKNGTTIYAKGTTGASAIEAMSGGILNISGPLTAKAELDDESKGDVIYARGQATVNIGANGETVKLNGNINFGYDEQTSGTNVDAPVTITLTGKDSHWNGNTYVSWDAKASSCNLDGHLKDESKLVVHGLSLTLKNDAVWTPDTIKELTKEYTEKDVKYFYGQQYTALNELTLDGGIVDVNKDVAITIENIDGKGAITNAGSVTIEKGSIEGPITFEKGDATADNMVTVGKDGITTLTGGVAGSGTIDKLAIAEDGETTITNAKLSGHDGRALWNNGTLTVNGGSFDNNSAVTPADSTLSAQGGAISNSGTLNISGVTFSNNKTDGLGGAIFNTKTGGDAGNITFNGTNTFTGNTAAGNANDIYNAGTITVADGTTTLNSGLILAENGTVKVTGGTLDMASGSTLNMGVGGTLTIDGGTFVADAGLLIKSGTTDGSYVANDANNVTQDNIVGTKGNLNLRWFGGDYTLDEYTSVKNALLNSSGEKAELTLLNARLKVEDGQTLVTGAKIESNGTATLATGAKVVENPDNKPVSAGTNVPHTPENYVSVVDNNNAANLLAVPAIATNGNSITAKGLKVNGLPEGSKEVTLKVTSTGGNNSTLTLVGDSKADTGVIDKDGKALATKAEVDANSTLNMGLTGNTRDQGLTLTEADVTGTLNANGGVTGTSSEYAINALTMRTGSKVNVLDSTMQIGKFTAAGGTMFVDPAYVKIDSVVGDFGTQLLVGSGSTVNIGNMSAAELGEALARAGMSVGPNFTVGAGQSVLALAAPVTLANSGKIVVDANVTSDGKVNGTDVKQAHFGKDSLLVVNGTKINGNTAALTLSAPSTEFTVQNGAKLLISGAQNGKTYKVIANGDGTSAFNGSGYGDSTADGWKGGNLMTSSDMVTLTSGDGMTFTAGVKDARDVFPDLSEGMTNAVNKLYKDSLNNVDSDQMGVRFLSRATDNRFLGMDKEAAAESIESAARIAFAGAAPQMTKMASDAATNAVVNRLGFANPADGAQAMDAEGKIVDRNTTGFALWIAPLWQSQHGWGLDAGNMDYGFNGNLGGVSLGADYTFENAIRAGITFNIGGGYAESSGGDLSSTENRMNFWGLGAYAGWNYENFGVMADVSYTSTWNDLKQDVDSRMGMGDLEADVQATAISAGLRAEYLLQTSAMDIIPHIGVRYMSLNTWGYDVDTHGGTVLEGDSLHQDIWTFPIGVTFSKDIALDSGWNFKPSLDFSVIPAAGDIKAKHDVHFTGLPGTYEVETQMMDYLTWQGGVGLELANDNMSIGVNYTLQAGQHTTGHGVFGSFRYEF